MANKKDNRIRRGRKNSTYRKLPLMSRKQAESNTCKICKKALSEKEVSFSLYNSDSAESGKGKMVLPYCEHCGISYAAGKDSTRIRRAYPNSHAEMFQLGDSDQMYSKAADILREASAPISAKPESGKSAPKGKDTTGTVQGKKQKTKTARQDKKQDPRTARQEKKQDPKSSRRQDRKNQGAEGKSPKGKAARNENKGRTGKATANDQKEAARIENRPNDMLTPQDILVRVQTLKCSVKSHKAKNMKVECRLLNSSGHIQTAVIPVAFCPECGKYYILDSEYRKTRKKGIILCQITEEGIDKKNIEQAVLSESPLFTMGYHVNSHYNLSQVQRWKILESIIDEEILSKDEVVEHIDRFIDQNKYKSSAARARLKWKIDQEHIAGYRKKRDYPQPARTKANTSDSTTKSQKKKTKHRQKH